MVPLILGNPHLTESLSEASLTEALCRALADPEALPEARKSEKRLLVEGFRGLGVRV